MGLLVLSRDKNEAIVINGNIEVIVVDVRGDKVKLGILAPKEVSVHRKEVQEAIDRESGNLQTERKAATAGPQETCVKCGRVRVLCRCLAGFATLPRQRADQTGPA